MTINISLYKKTYNENIYCYYTRRRICEKNSVFAKIELFIFVNIILLTRRIILYEDVFVKMKLFLLRRLFL